MVSSVRSRRPWSSRVSFQRDIIRSAMGNKIHAFRSQLDLLEPLAAQDQGAVELLFQQLQPVAHRRLGEKQRLRRFEMLFVLTMERNISTSARIHTNALLSSRV